MTDKQRTEMLKDAEKMPKAELAKAFMRALENLTALTAVLETYIGTDNVIRIAVNPNDEAFLSSLMGGVKPDPCLFADATRLMEANESEARDGE